MKTVLRAFGSFLALLALLGIAAALAAWRNPAKTEFHGGLQKPVIAMELVRTVEQVSQVKDYYGEANWQRELKRSLRLDATAFIPFYGALLLVFSLLLLFHRFRRAGWLGGLAVLGTLVAVGFDYRENYFINQVLQNWPNGVTADLLASLWHASVVKWAAVFITTGLLSAFFLWRRRWTRVIGALYLLDALTGLFGLAQYLLQRPNYVAIEYAFLPLLPALLLTGWFFMRTPQKFLAGTLNRTKNAAAPIQFASVLLEEYELHQRTHGLTELVNAADLASIKKRFNTIERKYAADKTLDEAERALCIKAETDRLNREQVEEFYGKLHQLAANGKGRAALCFSGGGVRSATFVLGVLQGLVKQGVRLKQFHYLSTVSGGGYTGSWLTAWLHRAGLKRVEADLCTISARPDPLNPQPLPPKLLDPLQPEASPLRHLRRFSNPLTPRVGLLSADTWVLLGIYLRNLSLNWIVLLPLLMAFLAVPRLVMALACWDRLSNTALKPPDAPSSALLATLPVIALVLGMITIGYIVSERPSLAKFGLPKPIFKWRNDEVGFLCWGLLPLLAAAVVCILFWARVPIRYSKEVGVFYAGIAAVLALAGGLALWRLWQAGNRPVANYLGRYGAAGALFLLGVGGLVYLSRQAKLASVIQLGSLTQPLAFVLFAILMYASGMFLSWLLTGRWDRREVFLALLPAGLIGGICLWQVAQLYPEPVTLVSQRLPELAATPVDKQLVKLTGGQVTFTLEKDQAKQQTALKLETPVTTQDQSAANTQRLLLDQRVANIKQTGWYICLGVPLFLLAFLAAATIFVGMSSGITTDADREWLGRAGAWMLMAGLGWLIVNVVVLFGPEWVLAANKYAVAFVTSTSGLTTLIMGWLPKTAATLQGEKESKGASSSLLKLVLPLAAFIFALSLFALLSLATGVLLRGLAQSALTTRIYENFLPDERAPLAVMSDSFSPQSTADWHWFSLHELSWPFVFLCVLLLLLIGGLMGLFINVNKFSLHAANRDRLMRAYLGASNTQRRPNPFTGFDPRDNLQMHELFEPLFDAASFEKFPAFVAQLLQRKEQAAIFVWNALSPATQQKLKAVGETVRPENWQCLDEAEELKTLLADELNRLIHEELFCTPPAQTQHWLRALLTRVFFLPRAGEAAFEKSKWDAQFNKVFERQPEVPVLPYKWLPRRFTLSRKVVVERVRLNRLLLANAFEGVFKPFPEIVEESRPFHVLNMALNLVSGKELAWQERKAESFFVSPLHAGSLSLGYRPAREYSIALAGQGAITLGTSMAISGAAANPNAGYHSSPLVTFFLSLFNVRMGWWLGNPGRAGQMTHRTSSPFFAPKALLAETFGFTDAEHPYINVSDGGHFDNLGIYEMVRRRVHFILVTDGGEDGGYTFDDVGLAIRLIRADLGVPIEFKEDLKLPIGPRPKEGQEPTNGKNKYCAIAEINYKAVDGEQAENGVLILVKPAVYGNEPADIYNYAQSNPAFPQDPTFTDQMFSESQFESYRHLGEYVIEQATNCLKLETLGLSRLEAEVRRYLRPPVDTGKLDPDSDSF